ncbi:MAG: OmpA family protein [Saprospiraceae bacterium]|nr:OmpA family protein [Saprospiraceae bacterium]
MKKSIPWLLLFAVWHLQAQHSLRVLPYPVNTEYFNEICPILSQDEKQLFYTRTGSPLFNKTLIMNGKDVFTSMDEDRYYETLAAVYSQIAGKTINNPIHSTFNQDVHVAGMSGDTIVYVTHPGYPLNNALPNSICALFGNGYEYIVINQFEEAGGMREGFSKVRIDSHLESSFPDAIVIDGFDKRAQEVNLTVSSDMGYIFIAMTRAKTRDKDIFMAKRIEENHYCLPIDLSTINTAFHEMTPYLSKDQSRLYFASDRPGGYGGLDVYYAERLDDSYEKWSMPVKLQPPLNSEHNESHPFVLADNNHIYFTSDRAGNSDIYSARLLRSKKIKKIKINIRTVNEDGRKFPAEIKWGNPYSENEMEWKGYFRSRDGSHTVYVEENQPIAFMAENRGLMTGIRVIDPQELFEQDVEEVTLNLTLRPIKEEKYAEMKSVVEEEMILPFDLKEGSVTVLNHIYFERSTAVVLKESLVNIKKLAEVLQRHPNLVISIDGHTDNVGDKNDLFSLSEDRARSIKKLLVAEGVPSDLILTKGYGDTRPLTDNSTEEKRQQNRRVEITIIKNQ